MANSGYALIDSTGKLLAYDGNLLTNLTLPNGSIKVLSSTSSIDFKTTGQTTLYTPSGVRCLVTDIFIEVTATNTATAPPTCRIGLSPTYNELVSSAAFSGLETTSVGYAYTLFTNSVSKIFNSGDVIKLDITVGATATTLTGTLYLIGTLVV